MRENETQPIFLARISAFEEDVDKYGCLTHAQVIPTTSSSIVTRPFAIHWTCRGKLGGLQVDDLVVCARFADGSGMVLARADGDRMDTLQGDLTIEGDVHVTKTLTADIDVIGDGTSLAHHTHTGVHGGTSEPN